MAYRTELRSRPAPCVTGDEASAPEVQPAVTMRERDAKNLGVLAGSAGLVVVMGYFTMGRAAPTGTAAAFDATLKRMAAAKSTLMKAATALLADRYDLANRPSTVKMSRGKPLQEGVRVKLPKGMTWDALAALTPNDIRTRDVFPKGFLPLPHPNHPEGGMLFPKFHIDEVKRQTERDLTRFDLDFDIPDAFLPEFPPAIFLTTHPELGDVSSGKLVTLDNYYDLFSGLLNPKQLEGLRLLVTPFPQQQFNATEDRRSLRPSQGVTCFDCHANGHTNGATHLVGDIRPQELRHRIETPSLRGVNIQRLFGSQRALKTVEDFTEFEQRAAYFDGDPVDRPRRRASTSSTAAARCMTWPSSRPCSTSRPRPSSASTASSIRTKATPEELRGQELFFGKAQCAKLSSRALLHRQHDARPEDRAVLRADARSPATAWSGDGAIKTFPLRGIKDSPPYLHDGRLLTIEDTVEFFNLVSETKLTAAEKKDLVAFLRVL